MPQEGVLDIVTASDYSLRFPYSIDLTREYALQIAACDKIQNIAVLKEPLPVRLGNIPGENLIGLELGVPVPELRATVVAPQQWL